MIRKTIFESSAFGATEFKNTEFGQAAGSCSFNETRVAIDGALSVNVCETAKFGHQIQLQVFGKGALVQPRNPSPWDRIELFFNKEQLDALIACLLVSREDLKKEKEARG